MLLIIDNYDSFTWNLYQYFCQLGEDVVVKRNDALTINAIEQLAPEKLVISPGPCSPDQAGISLKVVEHFAAKLPLLGVCLGHQAIAQAFGARIVPAAQVMHGKTSLIEHHQQGLFAGLPQPLRVTRYHSLLIDPASLPDCFHITAWSQQQEIMAIAHQHWPLYGVQFHPESILSQQGLQLLANFLQC